MSGGGILTTIGLIMLASAFGAWLIRLADRRASKDEYDAMTLESRRHLEWIRAQERHRGEDGL